MTVSKTRETLIFYSLFPINSVVSLINLISSNDGLVAFHYSSYGNFCVYSKSSIISTVVLPTSEIIESIIFIVTYMSLFYFLCISYNRFRNYFNYKYFIYL